ncbi:MAG: cytochrome c maturation protein CcmE [Acidobacteria bacterium]|nr:cytochrome c maturation protein CcmE [Acidobacteriota bacterium]
MRVKLMVAFIIAAGAAAILLLSGTSNDGKAVFYYGPSEVLAQPALASERLRLKGKVEPGSIQLSPEKLDLRFKVTDGQKSIPVHYHGVVPESFQEGLEVVADGRMGQGGVFEGHDLIVKCPSKYESKASGPQASHPEGIPLK